MRETYHKLTNIQSTHISVVNLSTLIQCIADNITLSFYFFLIITLICCASKPRFPQCLYNSYLAEFIQIINQAQTEAVTKVLQAVNTHSALCWFYNISRQTAEEMGSKCCCSDVVMSLWWSSTHLSFVRATTHKGQGNFSE